MSIQATNQETIAFRALLTSMRDRLAAYSVHFRARSVDELGRLMRTPLMGLAFIT